MKNYNLLLANWHNLEISPVRFSGSEIGGIVANSMLDDYVTNAAVTFWR